MGQDSEMSSRNRALASERDSHYKNLARMNGRLAISTRKQYYARLKDYVVRTAIQALF